MNFFNKIQQTRYIVSLFAIIVLGANLFAQSTDNTQEKEGCGCGYTAAELKAKLGKTFDNNYRKLDRAAGTLCRAENSKVTAGDDPALMSSNCEESEPQQGTDECIGGNCKYSFDVTMSYDWVCYDVKFDDAGRIISAVKKSSTPKTSNYKSASSGYVLPCKKN